MRVCCTCCLPWYHSLCSCWCPRTDGFSVDLHALNVHARFHSRRAACVSICQWMQCNTALCFRFSCSSFLSLFFSAIALPAKGLCALSKSCHARPYMCWAAAYMCWVVGNASGCLVRCLCIIFYISLSSFLLHLSRVRLTCYVCDSTQGVRAHA